jgi:hypothetical protein
MQRHNKKKPEQPIVEPSGPYHNVGDPFGDEHPAVFELVIENHVPFVNPLDYDIKDQHGIDPKEYFVTSGDAVEKAKKLETDLWQLAGDVRKQSLQLIATERDVTMQEAQKLFGKGVRPKKPKRFAEYDTAVWKAAGAARTLSNALKKAKGGNIFLETDRDEDHRLLCVPKNPRAKQE